jgi:hypothetical protein
MNVIARLILCVALFLGCSSPTSIAGGGTDFPNSTTMGAALSSNIASGNQWGDSVMLADTLPSLSYGRPIAIPAFPAVAGTSKTVAAASQTLTYNLSDTGTLRIVTAIYLNSIPDSLTESDTIVILYDSAYRVGVRANFHIYRYRGEKIFPAAALDQHYSFTDADGDGILNNRNGLPNQATLVWSSTDASGTTAFADLTFDGGADNNLRTATDNRILAFRKGRIGKTGDTLTSAVFFAYDGDSVIFVPGNADSCLIRVLKTDNTVAGKKVAVEAILVVFATDSAKNYPVYLASQTVIPGVRTVFRRLRGVHADSLFFAGDSVFADRVVDSSRTGLSDTLRYIFIKSPVALDNSGNRLVTLHRHIRRSAGSERERVFTLSDSSLVPNGTPTSGQFFMCQTFSDGYWVQIDGAFNTQAITGDYTDSKEKTGTYTWNRAGTLQ